MFAPVKKFFSPPFFPDDEDKTYSASLLNAILLTLFVVISLFAVLTDNPRTVLIVALMAVLPLVLWFAMRRGHVRLASLLLLAMLLVGNGALVYFNGTIRAPVASAFIASVFVAGLLRGGRAALVFAALCALILFGLFQAELAGRLPPVFYKSSGFLQWVTYAGILLITAVLFSLADRGLRAALARARYNERALAQSNRALRMLSECNQAVVRATDEPELLSRICRSVVEIGKYSQAWVTLAETDQASPAARAGIEQAGAVSISLPLVANEQTLGALTIASLDPQAFGAEESRLLQELAGDLTYGINALRTRAALRASEARLQSIFRAAPTGIGLVINRVIQDANDRLCEMTGYSRDELVGKSARVVYPTDKDYEFVGQEKYAQIAQRGTGTVETRWQRKDGAIINVLLSSTPLAPHNLAAGVTFTALDITERKQAEEAVRIFQSLADNATDAITISDLQGKITYANRAAHELLGYDYEQESLVGSLLSRPAAGEEQARQAQAMRQVMAEGSGWRSEEKSARKDGSLVDIAVAMFAVRDQAGQPVGIASIVRDITERKQAEEALRESAERYHLIASAAMDGFAVVGVDGRLLDVNEAYCRIIGYSRDEMLKMSVSNIEVEEKLDEVRARIQRITQAGSDRFESRHRRKDGRIIDIEISMSFMRATGHFMIFLRDITERKQAEEALRQKTEELENFFTCSLDLLSIADTDGYFHRLNQEWEEVLGYRLEELKGRRFLDFVHPDDIESTQAAVGELGAQKQVLNFVNRYRCKDGAYRWIEWRSFPAGKRIYAAARDITERVETEDRLKGLLREKDTLLAEVHHRVKNNLQVIISLLKLQAADIQDARVLAAFTDSQYRVKSMALVHERLYQSRNLSQIDLAGYIQELAASLLRAYAISPGAVELEVNTGDVCLGLDLAVSCGLLLNELITNSLKHAFPGGRGGKVRVELYSQNELLTLVVSDNGVGLPEQMNWQQTNSLGMQLIHTLATHDLRGTIELNRSGGTEFRITFPAEGR